MADGSGPPLLPGPACLGRGRRLEAPGARRPPRTPAAATRRPTPRLRRSDWSRGLGRGRRGAGPTSRPPPARNRHGGALGGRARACFCPAPRSTPRHRALAASDARWRRSRPGELGPLRRALREDRFDPDPGREAPRVRGFGATTAGAFHSLRSPQGHACEGPGCSNAAIGTGRASRRARRGTCSEEADVGGPGAPYSSQQSGRPGCTFQVLSLLRTLLA